MLASELVKILTELVVKHGDCPVTLEEEGNEYLLQKISVCTQNNPIGLFKVGDRFFHLSF